MDKKIISTEKAPQAIGPYSQAIVANGFLFTSGMVPIDPATNQLVEPKNNTKSDHRPNPWKKA